MKKAITLLLALIMLLSAVPAFASNTRASGPYAYEIKGNGTITITYFNWKNIDGDVFIPNMIDGYTVTGIGNEAFSHGDSQRRTKCTITLPEGVTTIGNKAFWNANIFAINIPNSMQHIGSSAFFGCPSCQFKIASNHNSFAVIDEGLYNKSKKELIAYSWNNIDFSDSSFPTITIPNGIQAIGAYVFANSDMDHTKIELPTTLTSIGEYAFAEAECSVIKGILPSLKTIGNSAFMECSSTACDLRMSAVETIGDSAFADVKLASGALEGINFRGSPFEEIGDKAFNTEARNGRNEFIIPTTEIEKIGKYNSGIGKLMTTVESFSPNLIAIPTGLNPQVTALPDTVTTIESEAFTMEVKDFSLSTFLTDIAIDAFPQGSTFIVDAGSYAELWCSENGFGYTVEGQEDDLSWLNS